jgi:diguanylate cyclase (GGDEF)-like protein
MITSKGLPPVEVLVIEDNPDDLLLTIRLLKKAKKESFSFFTANRISEGIETAAKNKVDVMLIDLDLPDSQGLDTFLRLKSCFPEIPIVVLSGLADEEVSRQAVLEGAQDYLIKGQTDHYLLEHSIRYAIERQQSEETIRTLAFHDQLTGLPNRSLFVNRSVLSLAEGKRYHKKTAIMQLDLDRFKRVNDNFGHEAGDEVLKELAERLKFSLRLTDTVSRLGGDEFSVLISEMNDSETAVVVANKILEVVRKPFGNGFKLTASVGIAISPDNGDDLQMLLRIADTKMYEAKKSGGDRYCLALPNIGVSSLEKP